MKYIVLILFFAVRFTGLPAQIMQPYNEDSLRAKLETNLPATTRINVLLSLSSSYFFKQADTCLLYATAALDSSRRLKYDSGIILGLMRAGEAMRHLGNLTGALRNQLEALELSQKIKNDRFEANSTGFVGMNYVLLRDYDHGTASLRQAIAMHTKLGNDDVDVLFWTYLARAYNETNKPDSAFHFLREARKEFRNSLPQLQDDWSRRHAQLASSFGDTFLKTKNIDSATFYYRRALQYAFKTKVGPNLISGTSYKLANVFNEQNQIDSSLYFARYAFMIGREKSLNPRILDASRLLAQLHRKTGKVDSVLFYMDIANDMNESMYGMDKVIELQLVLSQEQRRNQEIQQAEERSQNTLLLIGLVSITTIILIASILLFRSNRIKHKTNQSLQETLTELKSTQSQLIQAEKMASLGELTAGIAHEIQNPLNFVNNFSELNKELIGELKNEVERKNLEEIQSIAINIETNEEKIRHHGQRADAIVKSMLQHSRANSGKKELTDLNLMCDEYARLAYHGLRAKDKSADIKVETHFDPSLSKVTVVPQDIGRVILNLINNAFYTVIEKTNASIQGYTPTVKISTKQLAGKIEIHVEDNGMGIPDSMKEKIFQPFFTSKPTGQGTGLGLSLSYDIIKAHGGTIVVNSPPAGRAGKGVLGSEFIIQLPI